MRPPPPAAGASIHVGAPPLMNVLAEPCCMNHCLGALNVPQKKTFWMCNVCVLFSCLNSHYSSLRRGLTLVPSVQEPCAAPPLHCHPQFVHSILFPLSPLLPNTLPVRGALCPAAGPLFVPPIHCPESCQRQPWPLPPPP